MRKISLLSILIFATASIIFAQPAMQKLSDDCEKFSFDEPAKGIQICTQLIQAQPNNSDAFHNRGLAYERVGGDLSNLKTPTEINAYWENNRKALADFMKAVELDPKNSFKLASVMRVQKEVLKEDEQDQLLETIKKMREVDKNDDTAWLYERAEAYLKFKKKGDSDEVLRKRKLLAIDDYTALIKGHEDTNSTGYLYRGIVYFNLSNYDSAWNDLTKGRSISVSDGEEIKDYPYYLGKVCMAQEKYYCASSMFNQALQILNKEREEKSEPCREQDLKMDILRNLIEALKKQNKKEDAEKYEKSAKEKCRQ